MPIQAAVAGKTFLALSTRENTFFGGVTTDVRNESAFPHKPLVTDAALKRLFSGVYLLVTFQARSPPKPLVTETTTIRPFCRVYAAVTVQRLSLYKPFVTRTSTVVACHSEQAQQYHHYQLQSQFVQNSLQKHNTT